MQQFAYILFGACTFVNVLTQPYLLLWTKVLLRVFLLLVFIAKTVFSFILNPLVSIFNWHLSSSGGTNSRSILSQHEHEHFNNNVLTLSKFLCIKFRDILFDFIKKGNLMGCYQMRKWVKRSCYIIWKAKIQKLNVKFAKQKKVWNSVLVAGGQFHLGLPEFDFSCTAFYTTEIFQGHWLRSSQVYFDRMTY